MQQNQQLIDQVARIIDCSQEVPAAVVVLFHGTSKAITGYAWSWEADGDRFTVTARFKPDQREKRGDQVTLHLKSEDLWITGSKGTPVSRGAARPVSFQASTDSDRLNPIEGLSQLLRAASAQLQPV